MNYVNLSKRATEEWVPQENYAPHKLSDFGRYVSGWLDPEGKFWEHPQHRHYYFAVWWFKKEGEDITTDKVTELEKRGWIHISGGNIYLRRGFTTAQKREIYNWMAEHKYTTDFYPGTGYSTMKLNADGFHEAYGNIRYLQLSISKRAS